MTDYTKFIRDRITSLRLKRDVSEYQMSLELGQNKNYIQGISSGRSMPSMAQFLNICDYFSITPMEFFDSEMLYPQLVHKVLEGIRLLDESDIYLLLRIIDRLQDQK